MENNRFSIRAVHSIALSTAKDLTDRACLIQWDIQSSSFESFWDYILPLSKQVTFYQSLQRQPPPQGDSSGALARTSATPLDLPP
jgi:hypothetical protein